MRSAIIFLAFVIAGIVFCCAFVCATIHDIIQFDSQIGFLGYLTAVLGCGTFFATSFAALYAVSEYNTHKKELRTRLLGEYNQRYSTDKNIQKVLTWMLKVAIVDKEGNIVGADPCRCLCKPDVNTKEMFMRFFEELYLHIENHSIEKKHACELFSYYAIKFDEFKEFRLDITDYKSEKELEDKEKNAEKRAVNSKTNWTLYGKFVKEMRLELKK